MSLSRIFYYLALSLTVIICLDFHILCHAFFLSQSCLDKQTYLSNNTFPNLTNSLNSPLQYSPFLTFTKSFIISFTVPLLQLTMSLQSRYDNCLANILSLCSSTIITALSKKSFDLDKFCLQFVKYFNQMADIEQHFSSKTKRLSNQIVKLKSFLQKKQVSTNSAVSLSMQAQQQYINCSRATLKLKISGYPLNQSSQLKQIEEVEQESSGIKQNYQKQILSRQIQQNNRPATSISIKKHKRKLKTVDLQSLTDPDFRFNTCEQNKQPSQMALTGRTSLYQQLKRLKKQSQSCIKTSRYKWNHKIKRLI